MKGYVIVIVCENKHEQRITVDRWRGRDYCESLASLFDGTSPLYKFSPKGTLSIMGKCGICRSELIATVEEEK